MPARRSQRIFDIVLVLASTPLTLPVMLLVTLWVLFDAPGPVIHSQPRVGRGGRTFSMYKFRTLRAGMEDGATVAPEGDPRITRSGTLLRRWRLDELPQLFNVLRGDMSIVGPRPERPEHLREIAEPVLNKVYSVRPGLTGPAAIAFIAEDTYLANMPDPLDTYCRVILPAKLRLETEYVGHWSLITDLRIIVKTIINVLSPLAYHRSLSMIMRVATANSAVETRPEH